MSQPIETQERKPKVIIKRHQGEAQFFLEQLSDDVGIRMMLIPEGSFNMGSPEDEPERSTKEEPVHRVNVPSFFMGKYPVTQAQWRVVASLPQVNRKLKPDPSCFKGDNRPVEQVSWYDAVEFCQRLSQYTHRTYRLPTEAEWEYACRAGTTTPFHFGETIITDLANYRETDSTEYGWSGSYGRGTKGEFRKETTPVDHFGIANAFGLCDMHGNVWEWCLDHWHNNYIGAPNDGSAWLTGYESARRVLRGGSWVSNPSNCRCASRFKRLPGVDNIYFGFRVVCETFSTASSIDFSELIARTNVELKRLGWTSQQGRDYLVKTYGKRSRQLLTDEQLLDFLHYLESEPSPTASPIDFSELIARTNVELKRLGWTNQQGRDYLIKTYGKRSRQLLTDEQLLDFLHYLESEPSPQE